MKERRWIGWLKLGDVREAWDMTRGELFQDATLICTICKPGRE